MTQIIRVIYNQKGGVGKTTLAVNLAACAAKSGKRTLLIDSDPQGNASSYILGNEKYPDNTLADYYESCLHLNIFRQSIFEYITLNTKIPNLHLVACNRELEDLRTKLENKHKIMKLREGLKNNTYEQVYLDPPPANDFFSLACLIAATEIIIPIDCDAFSIRAATEIKNTIEEVRQDHNPNLRVLGIVVNQFQKGTKHSLGIIQDLQKIGFQILEPYIPSSVKIRESHSEIKPIVIGHPEHAVSQAIQSLFFSIENISQMKNIRNDTNEKSTSKDNNSSMRLD
ncbi:ParA family protein [Fluviispira vulneris]|uniref:ParA family protein n=1 Tax=Fluviispira vulneris TaxID=2763012 RepID=UPI00164781FD|nr:ParA family protein [Fluviispira vulneris]